MKTKALSLFFAAALLGSIGRSHDHYPAGIVDSNNNHQADAGEQLRFVPFSVSGTGNWDPVATPNKIFHLLPRPYGTTPRQLCGGYYVLDENPRTLFPADAFSFPAMSDGQYEDPYEGHAHSGAWIWMEIVSVTGPAGGQFGFWDSLTSNYYDTPTVIFFANQPINTRTPLTIESGLNAPYASNRFILSEGYDFPGEDPAGHIHYRSWTANKAGDYYVGFRLVDLSTSNNGGPWHPPSQIYTFHFQASPDFKPTVSWGTGNKITMTWGSQMGIDTAAGQTGIPFQIERATSLSPSNWQVVATITGTTAATVSYTDNNPPAGGKAFYRRKFSWFSP